MRYEYQCISVFLWSLVWVSVSLDEWERADRFLLSVSVVDDMWCILNRREQEQPNASPILWACFKRAFRFSFYCVHMHGDCQSYVHGIHGREQAAATQLNCHSIRPAAYLK